MTTERHRLLAEVRARHPRFVESVMADARVTAAYRGEPLDPRNRVRVVMRLLRMTLESDAFLAQCCYRARARCRALGVPILPALLHRLAILIGQVSIGDPVVVEPWLYLPHGQVVIDGFVVIGSGAVIRPFVTIGLLAGNIEGPTIGPQVHIGTGAKVLGPVKVGAGAQIGANAVVLADVPAGATAAGVPARIIQARHDA